MWKEAHVSFARKPSRRLKRVDKQTLKTKLISNLINLFV